MILSLYFCLIWDHYDFTWKVIGDVYKLNFLFSFQRFSFCHCVQLFLSPLHINTTQTCLKASRLGVPCYPHYWFKSAVRPPLPPSGDVLFYYGQIVSLSSRISDPVFCTYDSHDDPLVLTLSQTGRRYAAPLLRGHCTGLQCVQYAWVTLTPSLIHVCEHCKNRQYAEDWETLPHPSSSRGKSRVRGSASGLASVAGFVSGGEMGNVFTQRCWVE